MQCNDIDCGESLCVYGCFRANETLVRNLIYHITHSQNDVDDLAQEVFIKAYQSLSSFRGGSFRAYLAQIARNQCYDWLRRKKAKKAITYVELVSEAWPSTGDGPEEHVLRREATTEMAKLLDDLGDLDREIMLLRHVHQFSYEEIGAAVGMKPGAVRTRVSRARQRMVESLQRRAQHESSFLG